MNKREFVNELVREAIIGANTANAIEEYLTAEDLTIGVDKGDKTTHNDIERKVEDECQHGYYEIVDGACANCGKKLTVEEE